MIKKNYLEDNDEVKNIMITRNILLNISLFYSLKNKNKKNIFLLNKYLI